jgi:ATP-dependent Lon protease
MATSALTLRRELSEVPEKIKGKLNVIKVKWIDEVLDIALEK